VKRKKSAPLALRDDTFSRARARDVDKLVVEIARLMVDGEWSLEARLALAEREKVKPNTVDEWASDAGRMLRINVDLETLRSTNIRRLDETFASTKDAKAKVAAVAEQNKMLGLHAPEKVSVTVQAYEQLDDASMLARIEEKIAALTELRATYMARLRVVEMVPALPARGDDDESNG